MAHTVTLETSTAIPANAAPATPVNAPPVNTAAVTSNLFWSPQPIPPQPALAALRAFVLSRSEKRSPKWKFQIAPDLALYIQPKLLAKGAERFEGRAFMGDGVKAVMLAGGYTVALGHCCRIGFEIRADTPDDWFVKARSSCWPQGFQYGDGSVRPSIALRDRVVEAFRCGRFSSAARLMEHLSGHCLCCGKGLTDPVSMARRIGPECFGSASESLPFMFRLDTNLSAT
jgi:hypothetical protein